MGSSPRVCQAQRSNGLLTRCGVPLLQAWHRRWFAPMDLCPRRGVGEQQAALAVLLDPKVEFGWLCSALVTVVAVKVCGGTFLKICGGSPGGAFIWH
jgi:hypothetical protein